MTKRVRLPNVAPLRSYALAVALMLGLLVWFYRATLHDGLFADDFVATAIVDGQFAAPRAKLDLFNFAAGTPQDVQALRRLGSLPWWAPDDFRVAFLRPLSSALWYVDRALFGRAYGLYHAHSLAVFCLLVIAVSALYRRLLSPAVALLSTLMFAVDDSHQFPVLWLSNRGGIYALLMGVVALLAHIRFRTGEPRAKLRFAALTAVATSIGLLFGEWTLPMVAYIVAYELTVGPGPVHRRVLALAPSIIPSSVFLVFRAALHYGARGSGAYIDPGVDPLRFGLAVLHRVPVFIADMVWNIPSEWWDHGAPWRDEVLRMRIISPQVWPRLPGWSVFHVSFGILGCVALALGVAFCWKGMSERERKHLSFLTLGALGALVPVVGSFASTRLTIAAFLGICPCFALVLRECFERLRDAFSRRAQPGAAEHSARRTFAGWARIGALLGVCGVILQLQIVEPLRANIAARVDYYATTSQWALGAALAPESVAKQSVFMLSGGEFTSTFFFSYIWAAAGRPLPRSYYPITACNCAHFVQRTGGNELLLLAVGTRYLASGEENMFHTSTRQWREGETVTLDELEIRAEQVVDGTPGALRLRFARPLEDPAYVFLVTLPDGIVRWAVPPLGAERLVVRAAYPSWSSLERQRFWARIAPVPDMLWFAPSPGFLSYEPP
jgi:hypothetical protein